MPWRISLWRFTCKPDKRQPVPGLQDLPYGLTLAPEVIVLKTLTPCRILRLQTEVLMTTATSSTLGWVTGANFILPHFSKPTGPGYLSESLMPSRPLSRGRGSFSPQATIPSKRPALDDAMYALRALQSCLQMQAATA